MIPLRIALKGFLCFRDEQELRFDDAPLWMLTGRNGVGKSTVFDALTYALFGQHRDGKQNAVELVHKDRDGLSVEFDFALDGTTYRARRTLRRRATTPAVTQSLRQFREGKWEEIPDTSRQVDFDKWVDQHLGLSYETFTSSVVLMQGQAEKLIGAKKSERFKVLSAIVDLERFERLHEGAEVHRQAARARSESLQQQLATLPEVSDEALEQAAGAVAEAQAASERADAEADRLQVRHAQAQRWNELQNEANGLRQWCEHAKHLLADAEAIEREADRARTLRGVLPHLATILENRELLDASERASAALGSERDALTTELSRRDEALTLAERDWTALKEEIAADQRREQEISARLVVLAGLLARVRAWEQQRRRLEDVEKALASQPEHLDERLARAEAETKRLEAAERALSPLTRLYEEREGLRQTLRRGRDIEEEIQRSGHLLTRLEADRDAFERQHAEAAEVRQEAASRVATARAYRQQAHDQIVELDSLAGAPTCHTCGQELTPAHFEDEHARRRVRVVEAENACRDAEHSLATSKQREADLLKQKGLADARVNAEAARVADLRRDASQAPKDAQRHVQQCDSAYAELAEPFRLFIADEPPTDWSVTSKPTRDDLDAARRECDGLDEARRHLQEARHARAQHEQFRTQRDEVRRALADLERELPEDPAGLRTEDERLTAEDRALKGSLAERRKRDRSFPKVLDGLRRRREETRKDLENRLNRLEIERTRREEATKSLDRARAALPDDWVEYAEALNPEGLQERRDELSALIESDVEGHFEQLRQARANLKLQRSRLEELERQQAEVPSDARRAVEDVACDLAKAQEGRKTALDRWVSARHEEDRLKARREERRRLEEQSREADSSHRTATTLSRLLGRDFLQRHLLRQAERQIVAISNAILDRLSGGELRVELRPEVPGAKRADEALDLVAYHRPTGATPIGVAFLSGSQKFRVAVSLALGIGQYASKQHRPIQSVIIDEGFGCLDREGRQVMVQELQNLRSQLSRILLVSHQEEFVATFPDGYLLELRDGSTVASRVHR